MQAGDDDDDFGLDLEDLEGEDAEEMQDEQEEQAETLVANSVRDVVKVLYSQKLAEVLEVQIALCLMLKM